MQPQYSLRASTPADEEGIDALLRTSYPLLMSSSYAEEILVPALKLMTKSSARLLRSGTYYVAISSRAEIIGCGGWTLERPGSDVIEPGLGHMRHFGTHPGWIRQGIGRALGTKSFDAARAAGVEVLECYSSLNAVSFYTALGFETIRSIEVELAPNVVFPGALMRRIL